ncbi:plasmid mobilization relaxosome protein MobC [Rhodococcus qingshengii]|uniref:plasmid mobilization relaxosome protein MobC n=1 Tax=Rhodococcus qingshengii TaxID=334542 RepID=UPI0036F35642
MAAHAASPEGRARIRSADRVASPAPANAVAPAKRTRAVAVRLTVAEESTWIATALAHGHRQVGAQVREKAVAGYIRRTQGGDRRRPAFGGGRCGDQRTAERISRIGNNLNQIARSVNSGQVPLSVVEHLERDRGKHGAALARMADRIERPEK